MFRTRLGRLLATASLVIAPVIGVAAPASADIAASAATARSVAAPSTGPIRVMSWWFYGYYDTLSECKAAGNNLIDIGWINNYSCQYRNGRYELHVVYVE